MAMLDNMLHEETGQPAPTGELVELFEAPAAAPAMPVMPATAGEMPDISFGGEDEEDIPARTASAGRPDDDLKSLFDDDPEVVAQREITAAQADQRAREGGYGPVSDVRTASDGARKLGNVRGGKPASVDENLESIWERPGA
jgi:hypothetical protein